jgi:hypothetical protein
MSLTEWRAQQLVDDLFQRHLVSFSLSYTIFKRSAFPQH